MLLQTPNKFLLLSLWFVLVAFTQTIFAQSATDGWDALQKLKPGTKLTIKTKAGQKLNGRFKAVTADAITLSGTKASGKEVELKRAEVAEIRRKSGARTAGYAALFGALGFAGGYGIGYGIGEAKDARFRPEYPTAAVGAAAGAVVGAIIGSRGEVIYKSP